MSVEALNQQGFLLLKSVIPASYIDALRCDHQKLKPSERQGGIRNAEKVLASVKGIVSSVEIVQLLQRYMPKVLSHSENHRCETEPTLVRAILFDKTPEKNWLVAWHQDKTVCVTHKKDLPGWGPWSLKNKVIHVQPPLPVLEQQLALRIHLDAANLENGCLKVLPASHHKGLINEREIPAMDKECAVACEAEVGDVLLMKPHVLHASSKAHKPVSRRVLHLEFSTYCLPEGMGWATSF